jgi:signal transduction histidine kinase
MLAQLRHVLAPPVFPDDEEKTRAAEILNIILVAILIGAILASPLILIGSANRVIVSRVLSIAALILMALVALRLIRRGHLRFIRVATVIGLWAIVNGAIILGGGGVHSLGFSSNIILVLITGILLGRRAAIAFAILGILTGLAFVYANSIGIISDPSDTDQEIWLIQSINLGAAAVLLGLALRSIERAFARTRLELAERRRAEEALHQSEQHYRELYTATQRQAQELQLLYEIQTALWRGVELPILFHNVVESIAKISDYTHISFYLLQSDRLESQHQIGYQPNNPLATIPLSQGIIGKVARTGKPVLLKDVRTDQDYLSANDNIVAEVCIPVFDRDRVVGVLNIESTDRLSDDDLQLMLAVGKSIDVAIERARLQAEVQRNLEQTQVRAEELAVEANALSRALEQQRELDELQREFIQNVSHELRTPLGLVIGHAELLEGGLLGTLQPRQQESIDVIARRSRMLQKLVEEVIGVLVAENKPFKQDPIDLGRLTESLQADFQILAQNAGLTLSVEIEPNLPPIIGDEMALHRALDNLVGNAIKFTSAGGGIQVELSRDQQAILLEVSDSGEGIASDQLPHIFKRFYRGKRSTTKLVGGLGLGLALVKEIVDGHQGRIEVESQVGVGTTFRVWFPIGRDE